MTDPVLSMPFAGLFPMREAFGENPAIYRLLGVAGHEGICWRLPHATPILATDTGTVSQTFDNPGLPVDKYPYGLYVRIAHAWGESVYANLERIDVTLNQVVTVGQQIGLSGMTGNAAEPQLHFGIRLAGYDPEDGFKGYSNPHRYLTPLSSASTLNSIDDHPSGPVICRVDTAGFPLFATCQYDPVTNYWVEIASGSILYPTGWIPIPLDVPATTETARYTLGGPLA